MQRHFYYFLLMFSGIRQQWKPPCTSYFQYFVITCFFSRPEYTILNSNNYFQMHRLSEKRSLTKVSLISFRLCQQICCLLWFTFIVVINEVSSKNSFIGLLSHVKVIFSRFPLRLNQNFLHSNEGTVLITDQPYIFTFFQNVTKIWQ